MRYAAGDQKDYPGTMKQLIAMGVLGAAAVLAHAADWQVISQGPGGNLSIERGTLRRNGTHVLVWMKTRLITPEKLLDKSYDTTTSRVNINCADDTTVIQSTAWSLHDETIETSDVPAASDINPDSVIAIVEKAVCTPG